MLAAALVLFIIGALGGIVMARQIFAGQPPSRTIAIVHGIANVTALLLLIIASFNRDLMDSAATALVLFILAAMGGLFLVSFHVRHKPHPRTVVVIHGLIAASAIIALLIAVL